MPDSLRVRPRLLALAAAALVAIPVVVSEPDAGAATAINGSGSSFAGIEFQEWAKDVGAPPYNLNINYQSSSSGQGRQNFVDHVVDFGVSDIRYNKYDTKSPDPANFAYIPVTAGGVAFMYNVPGFGGGVKPINLSPLTVCGIFTTYVKSWNDPNIQADNPGVNLPNLPVTPVVRQDPAGTNFVLQEYCIQLHNELYSAFAAAASKKTSTNYPDEPTSTWPLAPGIVQATGSENAADTVAQPNARGYITAVETGYAVQRHFPVAAVQNDTGAFVTPTTTAVSTALSYATQQPDGTHNLNFSPGDPVAYNPSTYSYLLLNTQGGDASKGAAITQFAEYDLTYGQAGAPNLGYASIGRNLILFGLDRLKDVPGYVPPSNDMLSKIPATQAVPPHNDTPPTTGSSTGTTAAPGPSGTTGANVSAATVSRTAAARRTTTGISGSAGTSAAVASTAAVDPSAALGSPTGPLGQTGVETNVIASIGAALLALGEIGRRLFRRRGVT